MTDYILFFDPHPKSLHGYWHSQDIAIQPLSPLALASLAYGERELKSFLIRFIYMTNPLKCTNSKKIIFLVNIFTKGLL